MTVTLKVTVTFYAMKITILTYGSRGDVQPFIALALGLQGNGHIVKLAAPHKFDEFVTSHGINFVPLAGDPEEISRLINNAGANPVRVVVSMWNYIFSIAPEVSRAAFSACEGADLIIHSFLFTVGGHSWAREHNIPDVSVQTFPMFAPTREFPNVSASNIPPGVLSYFSHWSATQVFWYGGNSGYGPAQRANPDIPFPKKLYWPFDNRPSHLRTPLLFAYSPSILPRPGNWDEHIHVTGYFFLAEESYQPPDALSNFLAAGDSPICISFGSMVNRKAEHIDQIVREALKQTNNRGIILSGWGGVKKQSSSDLLYLESVPHDWLLPRCKMVIHHGGAGTTSAGLRAGIPNVVVPFTADQPFWGNRVYAVGVGSKPILVKNLSAARLVRAIAEAESNVIRERAQVIGQRIRSENGVEDAVNLIEAYSYQFKIKTDSVVQKGK
ncbi:MAG: glycosyltransferase family 1 protein [Chloroflexi bacterium]|nr:glycosyltransferase family 1 protein [Chloroflexota bacterium]